MPVYELTKMVHVVAVCMMVGATLCNGLLHMIVMRANAPQSATVTLSNIMTVNRVIMAPAFIGIVASGLAMAFQAGFAFSEFWLLVSILLTAALIAGFIGGYGLERQLERIAEIAKSKGEEALPDRYWSVVRRAVPVGAGAAAASVAVIYLMIAKP